MLLAGKIRKGLRQQFGFIPNNIFAGLKGSPRIWVHAVSVGEVTAAAPIIVALKEKLPGACIVLSTTTDTGQAMARRIATAASAFIYYPLDISFAVKRAVDQVLPDIFVPVETELWPNFIRYCRSRGVKIIMANGRLSPRSFRKYNFSRFFWKDILSAVSSVGAISETDAERFRFLGMPPDTVKVFGNAKYDSLAASTSPAIQQEMSLRLNLSPGTTVLVAGSTHEGEEKIVLDVYRQFLDSYPDGKLILAPRHIERSEAVITLTRDRGFEDIITMTEIAGGRNRHRERIIIVDAIGELFKLYSLATMVFCGGSLVPKGGQNILEAAAWGKVIFYGPFMDDFLEEKTLLEAAGAAMTVQNGGELLDGILKMMTHPDALAQRGEEGRRMVAANMGASSRYAEFILNCLPPPSDK
jgi:3-deoxy-D-manno-octulosonic-acid transferase